MAAEINPLALERLRAKTPVGSPLNTAEWEQTALGIRHGAFFSAEVEKLRMLQRLQQGVEDGIKLLRSGDRDEFIVQMQKAARAEGLDPRNRPGEESRLGGLRDITSVRRLALIHDFNKEQTQEFARWKAGNDPAVLAAFPAQELVRVRSVKKPRGNWEERFVKAGGRLIDGRMIALKNDPVWRKLSRFGTPYPPFDFGSGMGLRDIRRAEAEKLGLIQRDDPPPVGAEEEFNAEIKASIADLNPEYRRLLEQTFDGQLKIEGDTAHWTPLPVAEPRAELPPLDAEPVPAEDEPTE